MLFYNLSPPLSAAEVGRLGAKRPRGSAALAPPLPAPTFPVTSPHPHAAPAPAPGSKHKFLRVDLRHFRRTRRGNALLTATYPLAPSVAARTPRKASNDRHFAHHGQPGRGRCRRHRVRPTGGYCRAADRLARAAVGLGPSFGAFRMSATVPTAPGPPDGAAASTLPRHPAPVVGSQVEWAPDPVAVSYNVTVRWGSRCTRAAMWCGGPSCGGSGRAGGGAGVALALAHSLTWFRWRRLHR